MQNDSSPTGSRRLNYVDFEVEIGPGEGREYSVTVVRSPAGEARETMHFPFDELALDSRLKDLQIELLRSGRTRRRVPSSEEQSAQDFGRDLFDALLTGEVRSRYDVSWREAIEQGRGLRLKLRIQPPELAALPWEFIYDSRQAEYVCLSRNTPVVRYLELPQPIQPLAVTLPLRILGMIASPQDQPPLDIAHEKRRVERAVKSLRARGLVDLTWLEGQTWRDLQRAMRGGPWHVFHFIGHGGFDHSADEGFIVLADEQGRTDRLSATQLGRLLADHLSLRLALLNSCEGARGSESDVFSSTAAILVRRGIPAVLAMQYEITDQAAIEFSRAFYETLADGMPVDAAVTEARKAISVAETNTVEWAAPVLYMRSPDGALFDIHGQKAISRLPAPRPSRIWGRLHRLPALARAGLAAAVVLVGGALLAILIVALASILSFGGLLTDSNDKDQVATFPPVVAVSTAVTPTPTPVAEAPTSPAPSAALEPTLRPPPTVESVTEMPTSVPPSLTSEPTPLPPPTVTPEPVAQRVGRVRFLSTLSRLDTVHLQLAGVEAAPAGKHYEGWLISDSGSAMSIGTVASDANGNVDFVYTDPEGRNLAVIYPGFRMSLEPDFGDSPEMSQEVVFEGAVNSAVIPIVREAIQRSPETPLRSLIEGLETETALGLDHLVFARNGLTNNNLAEGLNHSEHVVNILVGSADERFGDKNGDGQAQNPGDGYGVLGYLNTLLDKTVAAGQADPTSAELALHVGFLETVIQNSLQRAEGIVQLVERCFLQDSAASALSLVDQAMALHDELLNGLDINGNRTVEPIQGEGGILLVVQHAGYLANIEVYRVQEP